MRNMYIFYNMFTKSYAVQSGHDESDRKNFQTEQELSDYFKKDSQAKKILERGKVRFILDVADPVERVNLEDMISSLNVKKYVIEYYSGENQERIRRYQESKSFFKDF